MLLPLTQGPTKVLGCRRVWNVFLSYSCKINLAPSVSESLRNRNDFEPSGRNGSRKSNVSRLHVLIGYSLSVSQNSTTC